jgi:type I restriction enzyme S subunit
MTRTAWRRAALGEILHVKHGFAFKGEHFSSSGDYLILTPGHFEVGGGMKFREGSEKFYRSGFPPEFLLTEGDLLVVMTDLKQDAPILGSPAFVPSSNRFLHNQRLGKITVLDPSRCDVEFLYYLLIADATRAQIRASATGATVRHTAPERIYRVQVSLPPLTTQRKIASILSAYDDLIENNIRRIQILEEMAQAIYREWFVEFRFPGHEDVPMVDSELGLIPEGWRFGVLKDAVRLLYGKALKAPDRRGGQIPVFGSGGIVGWHDEPLAQGPGIVVGRKGNVGAVYRVDTDFFPIDTTYYVQTDLPLTYVYFALRELDFLDSHAAVPGLSRDQAYALRFLLPDPGITSKFDETILAVWQLADVLSRQCDNLRSTRDLLLPRLISGEIDVSHLDIGDAEPAA